MFLTRLSVSAVLFLSLTTFSYGQGGVGIGTSSPHASAALEISSTSKGLLLPRLANNQMYSISGPEPGLLVYNTTQNTFYGYMATTELDTIAQLNASSPIISGNRVGQSFTASGDGQLLTIAVYGTSTGTATSTTVSIQLDIHTGSGGSISPQATTVQMFSLGPFNGPISKISFDVRTLNVSLRQGQTYTFFVRNGGVAFQILQADAYSGGSIFPPIGNYDIQFEVTSRKSGQWVSLN